MKWIKRGFLLLIVLLTALFLLLSLRDRRQELSVYENRRLASHPDFSVRSVWDGSYFRGWDDYFSDHVYRRDDQMRAYQWLQLKVKRVVAANEVVIAGDCLLPYQTYMDFSRFDYDAQSAPAAARLIALQNKVEGQSAQFLYLGVDEQRTALADRYPAHFYSKSDYYEGVNESFRNACRQAGVHTLFVRDHLDPETDPLTWYSAVDHHFNFRGAYQCYRLICGALWAQNGPFPIIEEADLGEYELPGEFYGSYNRKLYNLSPIHERLTVFDPSVLPPYERWDNGERTDAPILDLPEEGEKVQYTVYMGGDKGETVIQTNRPELPSILIVGDSFTNPIEALCVYSFNEVRSLDFRHYHEMSLTEYLSLHHVDAVVVIRDNLNYTYHEANGALE